jgi:predicted RND superfamily exporter protein
MLFAGPGVLTGALTSATAFLTVLTAEFTAFGELGVNAAIGLVLVFLVTMLVLPILLARSGIRPSAPPPLPGISRLPRLLRKAPRGLLACALLSSALGASALASLEFNTRYFDFLPRSLESSRALQELERDGAMSPMFAFATAGDLEEAREMTEALRALESVAEVHSASDLLPPLDAARQGSLRGGLESFERPPDFDGLASKQASASQLAEQARSISDALDEVAFALDQAGAKDHADAAGEARDAARAFARLSRTLSQLPDDGRVAVQALQHELADILRRAWTTAEAVDRRGHYALEDLPETFRIRHAAKDGSGAVALFIFPAESIWVDESARRFIEEVQSVDPNAAGHAFSVQIHSEMIIHDFVRAALIAALLVCGIMLIDFRRPGDALLAMVPVLVGSGWALGIMAAVGLRFDAANIVVLPMIFGLGIDAGVHTIHRCRQSAREHGHARLEDLVEGTGAAVVLASLTTMVGFMGLLVADYGGTASLGTVMVLGVGCCLLASVLVLPSVLIILGRAR